MEYAVIATPDDAVGLRLDWERFAYAGKFVMTNTGKAVALEDCDAGLLDDSNWPPDPHEAEADGVVAAVSFNRDREHRDVAWLRYVTVRNDRRGQGIAPRLCAMTANWLVEELSEVTRVRIAVNNSYAFDALYKAGFGWTGEETGIRERVLERPSPGSDGADARADQYWAGLRSYLDTDLSDDEREFIDSRLDRGPPDRIDAPKGEDYTGGARTHR